MYLGLSVILDQNRFFSLSLLFTVLNSWIGLLKFSANKRSDLSSNVWEQTMLCRYEIVNNYVPDLNICLHSLSDSLLLSYIHLNVSC